jgi:thiamine kinase-like enzyme
MYNKGMKALLKFKENLEKIDFPNKENTQKELNYMLNFSNNLLDIFYSVFPLNGYLTLNHNDTLRLNFLQKDDKILIIDHEYGSLNLPGFDIVNYLVESNFDSSPEYIFVKDDIDFNKYYNIYLGFLKEFEKSKKHSYFFTSEEGKKQLNIYKSYEYFSNLIVLDIILWFVFGLIYFDFNKFVKNEGFNYFKYSYDRIVYYDLLMKFNESRNESKSISRNSTSSEDEVIVNSN